jgi:glycerophosphoryl diester phosphodiesterase
VLYYNDFSTAPTDFRIIQATGASAYHDGAGRYVLDASSSDASYCRVLLPKFLDDFGDFRLDVICQDTAPNTERNWFSLMAHVQNTDYPFLHLCVRNNAALSDGLEIAERTPGNKWDIKAKASSTKKTANAFNTISMTVQNNIVKGYVNGEGVITYNTHSYMTGGIGLQAKGLKLIIDQVKITLGDNLEAEDAAVKCTVSKSRPAIGCNAGQTVLLSKCDVQFTYGSFPVKGSEIVWKKDGQVITSFSDTTVGLHTLTATHGHTTMNVYVVVKNATDPEYVLYYNDFTQGPTDYRVPETSNGGKVYPINGTFVLNGSADANAYVRVLLPSYLDQFGDADFYASVKLSGAVDSSKWASLMYRVQNGVVPYLQCSWRYNTNTSNGIELTERTSSGTWNVLLNSATTAHKPDQFNSILLSVSDLETSFSINGNQVIYSSSTPYHNGAWGFQVRGLTMTVDEVKLSFTQNENAMSIYAIPGGYVDVREPVTSITAAPALVTQVRTRADFDNILVDCPAVAIFEYDVSDGIEKIVFSDGAVTPDQVMDKLGSKIIPAFRIDTDLEADRLASFLKGRNQQDAYAVSTTLSVLKRAYGNWKYIRGVADFSAVGAIDAEKLRYDAMANTARVVIMPEHTTRAQVTYIQDSFSCVWLCVSPGKTASVAGTNKGPYGLVTPDRSLTESCYRDFYGTSTLIRRTNIIGHRGNLSLAPENTVYGTNLAYSNGANGVETDIYLSTDHVVIVMHDETLDRTTNGTGKVVELSSAQIKKYLVDYYSGVSPQPIPTLEDYFKAIKGKTDRKLVIEMKHPANADLSNALAALLQAYDISDQVVCISFLHSNLNHIRNVLPGAPAGLLSWLELDENNPVYSTYAAIENIQGVNSVCNPGYSGWGDRVIRQLLYRGVTLWPWTVNKENQFDALMMDGVAGITTDYPQWAKNYIESIHWNSASRVISSTYNDVLTDVTNSCEVVVIEDTLGITCSAGNIIVPENPLGGKATFYYRYRSVSPAGVPYYTVTEIRTIEVQSSYRFELKENSALALNDGYLLKLTGGYTVRQLKDQFVDPVEIINGQGTVLSDGDIVSTGCQVYLQSDPSKRAIVVLRGDVNGDGAVNRDDNLLIRAYFYGQFDPQGVWFMAADCDGDGEITITDYLRQRAHYLTGFDLYS